MDSPHSDYSLYASPYDKDTEKPSLSTEVQWTPSKGTPPEGLFCNKSSQYEDHTLFITGKTLFEKSVKQHDFIGNDISKDKKNGAKRLKTEPIRDPGKNPVPNELIKRSYYKPPSK